jgi:hypothetical protein
MLLCARMCSTPGTSRESTGNGVCKNLLRDVALAAWPCPMSCLALEPVAGGWHAGHRHDGMAELEGER